MNDPGANGKLARLTGFWVNTDLSFATTFPVWISTSRCPVVLMAYPPRKGEAVSFQLRSWGEQKFTAHYLTRVNESGEPGEPSLGVGYL